VSTTFERVGPPPAGPQRADSQDINVDAIGITAIPRTDPDKGWVLVAKYPSRNSTDQGYRTAHQRGRRLKNYPPKYLKERGQFEVRVGRLDPHTVGVWMRWLGIDGQRWADA